MNESSCFSDKIPERFLEKYNLIHKIPTGEVEKHQTKLKRDFLKFSSWNFGDEIKIFKEAIIDV